MIGKTQTNSPTLLLVRYCQSTLSGHSRTQLNLPGRRKLKLQRYQLKAGRNENLDAMLKCNPLNNSEIIKYQKAAVTNTTKQYKLNYY